MSPNLGSVTLANASQAYSLDALITAAFSGLKRPSSGYLAQFVAIQSDPGNAGAKLAIGNSTVTLTNTGSIIFAAQTWPIYSVEANLINLNHIYLYTDTPGIRVNLAWLTR